MKFNDEITLDIAKAVSDVMEGKAKKEEVKYPHKMYHPETGEEVEVQDKAGHDKYSKLGYTHTPKEVAQPKPKGEKEFKSIHDIEVSGEAPDGKVKKAKKGDYYKEEATPEGPAKEESEKQKKYQAFFNKALKKFGVKSPSELDDEKKKEFFDYVDANYEADNETDESVNENEKWDKLGDNMKDTHRTRYDNMRQDLKKIAKEKEKAAGNDSKLDFLKGKEEKIKATMKKYVDNFGSAVTSEPSGKDNASTRPTSV